MKMMIWQRESPMSDDTSPSPSLLTLPAIRCHILALINANQLRHFPQKGRLRGA